MYIDVSFDFTEDSPGYWDHLWENRDGLGIGNCDPDSVSPTLREYHRQLWSKRLPNGEQMVLKSGKDYLTWKDFRFGSDSILASFRYKDYRLMIEKIASSMNDYKGFMEDFLHKSYTIGGMIIFPKRNAGINQSRGTNPVIRDRWDLTLECIRRYYAGENSPLTAVLEKDKTFFDLFVDFKGFVDFFFLQDCVSSDYESVCFWEEDSLFQEKPFPKTVDSYLKWIDREKDFLKKRNERIRLFCQSKA